jgi:predicted SAM-dependent methyltransferase
VKPLLKRFATTGFRRAAGQLIEEFHIVRRHRSGLAAIRRQPLPPEPRVQLGSGDQPKAGWINIDLFNPNADFALDLREDLPFPDDSIAFVYSEHLFEHLEYPRDAKHLLCECRRILRPGGVLSLVIPHFGQALQAYATGDTAFFAPDRLRSYLLEQPPTAMHHVNYWFRQDGLHRYAYDEETLAQEFRAAGFVDVRSRNFDPTLDSEKRYLLHSLYMDGVKPH